jgi:hypothetical protein
MFQGHPLKKDNALCAKLSKGLKGSLKRSLKERIEYNIMYKIHLPFASLKSKIV